MYLNHPRYCNPRLGTQATPCVLACTPTLLPCRRLPLTLSCVPCPHSIQSAQDGSGSHDGTLEPRAQLEEGVPWPADTTEALRRGACQGESFIVALVLIISSALLLITLRVSSASPRASVGLHVLRFSSAMRTDSKELFLIANKQIRIMQYKYSCNNWSKCPWPVSFEDYLHIQTAVQLSNVNLSVHRPKFL